MNNSEKDKIKLFFVKIKYYIYLNKSNIISLSFLI